MEALSDWYVLPAMRNGSVVFLAALATLACTRDKPDPSGSSQASLEASTAGGDRVEGALRRVVPEAFERVDGGFILGPMSSAQEAELRREFNITSAPVGSASVRLPIELLRNRVTSAPTAAARARSRLELANRLLEAGKESEALEHYRAVAALDWNAIGDGDINPVLAARVVLQKRGER